MDIVDFVKGLPTEFVEAYEKNKLGSYFFGNQQVQTKVQKKKREDHNENLFTLTTFALKELFHGNGFFFDPQSRDLQCHLHALNISRICLWPGQ